MATIAAGASTAVTVAVGTYLEGTGAGTAIIGRAAVVEPLTAGDAWQVGPFDRATLVSITAGSAITYTVKDNMRDPSEADKLPLATVSAVQTLVSGAGSLYPILATFPGLLAFWDFSEPRAPFVSKAGRAGAVALYQGTNTNGTVARVTKSTGGPLGHSVVFNGTSDFLIAPAATVGALNIGAAGGREVFVLAFVKRTGALTGNADFVAGIWQEDDTDPRRQYGLFCDLGTYGGAGRVCMHISKTGGASPGIIYSRDYSANGLEALNPNQWKCISGRYDGTDIRSYVEGRFEPYASYTESSTPTIGDGRTLAKNPYVFPDGLNSASADFTVGACKLSSGFSNWFAGEIAALLVMDAAPTLAQVVAIQEAVMQDASGALGIALSAITVPGACSVLYDVSCYRGGTAIDDTASNSGVFQATRNATDGNYYVLRNTTPTGAGFLAVGNVQEGLTADNLNTASIEMAVANTGDAARLAIRIDSTWYATEATYTNTNAAASGADWTNAETKTITFAKTAANWRDLTVTPGSALTLAGAARGTDLPSGAITGFGVYVAATPTAAMRFRNIKFKRL